MKKIPDSEIQSTKNCLEWTVFGLSCVLVVGVMATLLYEGFTMGDAPAHLEIKTGSPLVNNDQVRIPVSVSNLGDKSAVTVEIEIAGKLSGSRVTSELQFDYIPHHAMRKGWAAFPGGTVPSELTGRVLGYADP